MGETLQVQARKEPQSPEEWQDAVNMCEALLMFDSAQAYGLITGGPQVETARCAELIAAGKLRGITPQADGVKAFMVGFIRAHAKGGQS